MNRRGWPLLGLAAGAIAGGAWGWFGAGGYEAIDSAAGTAFLGGLAGLLTGSIAYATANEPHR